MQSVIRREKTILFVYLNSVIPYHLKKLIRVIKEGINSKFAVDWY